MREINYNTALTPGGSLLPLLFCWATYMPENSNNIIPPVSYKVESNGYDVFQSLSNLNINLEVSQKDILIEFISKISSESTELEGEIVDMVNRKFEKLLLKI